MLSSAHALLSPVPGAFSALGVGTVASLGMIPLASVLSNVVDLETSHGFLNNVNTPEQMKTAFAAIAGFGAVFMTYAFGLISIQLGGAMRQRFWGSLDAETIAYVVSSKNEFLQRLFLETRNSITVLDGFGVALLYLFSSTTTVVLVNWDWYWVLFFGPIAAVCSCYLSWRQSNRYLLAFADIVYRISRT
ncbi:hypothetical protein KUH32_10610 [Thalassococcus sp. CAU 1522]|uniref:ABC transmembrane type-1 domain-containing protein n=1 Tax=Thalassococcus arenae TaxID=2851652 RepID=A0ABS6N953_9RHOB|nr:hypothetical protein [Thalassococcus arenae]MBV2360227.1 hypothetical protein [Thalassococcus arenae]